MRGFLGFVFVLLAALVVAALVIVPIVARPIVADTVREALPFRDQPVNVEVELNPVGLLAGTIDRIHVSGTGLRAEGAVIGELDMTVTNVSTTDHRFRTASGRLRNVELPFVQSSTLTITSIELDGPYGDVAAVALLDVRASLAVIGNAFADAGIAVDGLELVDGGIAFSILDQRVEVAVAVDAGALVIPDVLGGPLVIVEPGPDDPWRLTAVRATTSGFEIDVALEPEGMLDTP
ncbi:MAG TPA: hypothetical protein VFP56_07535 [Candidatus Limnocylindrales bacterium]|nr:hypothetical protein [Candidatus Limnocylindrales bacterium]